MSNRENIIYSNIADLMNYAGKRGEFLKELNDLRDIILPRGHNATGVRVGRALVISRLIWELNQKATEND